MVTHAGTNAISGDVSVCVGGLVCRILGAAVGRWSVNSGGMYSMTARTDRPGHRRGHRGHGAGSLPGRGIVDEN